MFFLIYIFCSLYNLYYFITSTVKTKNFSRIWRTIKIAREQHLVLFPFLIFNNPGFSAFAKFFVVLCSFFLCFKFFLLFYMIIIPRQIIDKNCPDITNDQLSSFLIYNNRKWPSTFFGINFSITVFPFIIEVLISEINKTQFH